jgi:hypothetical protein
VEKVGERDHDVVGSRLIPHRPFDDLQPSRAAPSEAAATVSA